MLIKKEITINADIKKVWSIFSKFENWPKWSGYILKIRWISKDKWKKDSQFEQIVKGFAFIKTINSNSKILKVRPHNIIIWSGTRKLIKGTHIFKFQKIGSKTKVLNMEHFNGLLAPFIFPFLKSNFEQYFEQFLKGLKKEAEK